jgi:hypothetical protein
MTGRRSRNKGAAGERELAKILAAHGFAARRTPNSGALAVKGDITGMNGEPCIPGYHIECKRQETLRIPEWLRQAHADAGINIPLLIFRRNDNRTGDPLARFHVTLPLADFLPLVKTDARQAA